MLALVKNGLPRLFFLAGSFCFVEVVVRDEPSAWNPICHRTENDTAADLAENRPGIWY